MRQASSAVGVFLRVAFGPLRVTWARLPHVAGLAPSLTGRCCARNRLLDVECLAQLQLTHNVGARQ
jgi:hypothetical protein